MIAAGNAQNESTDLRTTSTSDFAKFAAEQRRLLLHLILRLKYVWAVICMIIQMIMEEKLEGFFPGSIILSRGEPLISHRVIMKQLI